jgi:hypothetical protein
LYLVQHLVDHVELGMGHAGHGMTVRMTADLQEAIEASSTAEPAIDTVAAPLRNADDAAPVAEQPPAHEVDGTPAKKGTH